MKNRWKDFFGIKTIRNRIITVQLAVIIPAILILGILIYSLTGSLLIRMNSESYYKILESSDVIMNQLLSSVRDTARNILSDKNFQREMIKSNEDLSDSALMNELTFVKLGQSLEKYLTGFYGVKSIYLYDCNGKLFFYDPRQDAQSRAYALNYEEVSESEWFRKVLSQASDGYEIFFGYNVIHEKGEEFSCVKVIKNLETQEAMGIMVLNFSKEIFEDIFPFYKEENGNYAIVDKDQKGWHFVTLLANESTDGETIEKVIKCGDDKYYTAFFEDKTTGWQLTYTILHKDILGRATSIKDIIGVALVITISVLLILTILICNRITKPLYQLQEDIVKVENGERYVEHHFPDDEIGAIGQEFRKLVNEKIALSDRIVQTELRTKEAELELLQSNINPHFLYNTLDSLYWMAIYKGADDVAELTKALSDVFRIALSKGEKQIRIQEELDFIKSYLCIQNISFGGKIRTDLQIDDRVMKYKVPKLILQPFVENAVHHGLEPKIGEGSIVIRIYDAERNIVFEIIDNGVGISDIEEALKGGYAVRNSIERIKLIYGDSATVQFISEPGKGTKVSIIIPKDVMMC